MVGNNRTDRNGDEGIEIENPDATLMETTHGGTATSGSRRRSGRSAAATGPSTTATRPVRAWVAVQHEGEAEEVGDARPGPPDCLGTEPILVPRAALRS